MYIDADFIIKLGAVLAALGTLWAMIYKLIKWMEQLKRQDEMINELRKEHKEDIKVIQKEQCVMCYALLAALDGLKQLGANGNVTDAYQKLEKHLNRSAHETEEG
ncbi:branched-chain amino acid ABC transporter permease [Anaerotignum sp.]